MSYLSDDVLRALEDARTVVARKSRQLCLHTGDKVFPISRLWSGGFAIATDDAPRLRGTVDLYDGPRHLTNGLIVTSRQKGAEWVYEFQWTTTVTTKPELDYIQDDPVLAARLTRTV